MVVMCYGFELFMSFIVCEFLLCGQWLCVGRCRYYMHALTSLSQISVDVVMTLILHRVLGIGGFQFTLNYLCLPETFVKRYHGNNTQILTFLCYFLMFSVSLHHYCVLYVRGGAEVMPCGSNVKCHIFCQSCMFYSLISKLPGQHTFCFVLLESKKKLVQTARQLDRLGLEKSVQGRCVVRRSGSFEPAKLKP